MMIRGCASNGGIAAIKKEAAAGKPEAYRRALRQSRINVVVTLTLAVLRRCQRVDPLPEADRISLNYELMASKPGFNAAQTGSARCLAE